MAQETIRVAVFQDMKALNLKSDGDLTIHRSHGDLLFAKPVNDFHIVPSDSGLLINQQLFSESAIRVGSSRGDIRVNGQIFGGVLDIINKHGLLQVVETLDLEDYLQGVVPLELNSKWHPEVLKVQAIVARTYALYQKRQNNGKDYDLVATTNDQLYGGKGVEDARAAEAVRTTRGQVLTYAGQVINSVYHSTSAGPTEDAREVWGTDLPYLHGVDCPFDAQSPWYQWDRAIDLVTLEENLRRKGFPIGIIATMTPYRFSQAGRVTRVRILHSEGELILRGEELRRILGYTVLPSSHFKIEAIGQQIHFTGMGSGHGVGLCQWGAKELAERGYSYERILTYYYPGVQVQDMADLETVKAP
ncbi:MAG TPA: SpoIID/LytB domain-containing protein [Nitrospiria bacterium]|jgi:stage II sporulation protein D|nr:SpoIID/LytB domain-containing protein [Nitrospiria bacterium]